MARASGLGRGLKALIDEADTSSLVFLDVDTSLVFPNPSQPRRFFDELRLEELAQSVRENGIIQPLVVRRMGSRYEIIAGERRWRAAKLCSLESVPVIVKNVTDAEAMKVGLLENLQREDLNPIEEAEAFRTLMEDFSMTQEALAETLGKSRPSIANSLRLLGLAPRVREMVERGVISMGHARALLSIGDPDDQVQLAQRVLDEGLSVRDVERICQKLARSVPRGTKLPVARVDPDVERVQEALQSRFGTKVRLRLSRNDGGRIEIEYFSREELDRLLETLLPDGV